MARTERAIFTNLCMVYDDKGNVLVQDRKNPNWKGIAFPGGHVEAEESFTDAVIREVYEETGLRIEHPVLCGVKQFPLEDGTRYVVFCYKTNRFSGELRSSSEGEVFWIKREALVNCKSAPDFMRHMLIFETDEYSEFYLSWKENGEGYDTKLL